MKLTHSASAPIVVTSMTPSELAKFARHVFTSPTPLLEALIQIAERARDDTHTSQGPQLEAAEAGVKCPCCGTVLQLESEDTDGS